MTDPDDWSEMILRNELRQLSEEYQRVVETSEGSLTKDRQEASEEIKKRMRNVEGILEVISKLNFNLNVKE